MLSYIDEIKQLAEKVNESIGVDIFKKAAKGRVPSQVSGEFITNREQGDWAEVLFLKIVNAKCNGLTAISYGRGENLIAGDPGFKEFFEAIDRFKSFFKDLKRFPMSLYLAISEFLEKIYIDLSLKSQYLGVFKCKTI